MNEITITKENEVYMRVIPNFNDGLKQNLSDMFAFHVPDYFFQPKFRMGVWDGKIRLYDIRTGRLYLGLYPKLIENLKKLNITYDIDPLIVNNERGVSQKEVEEYVGKQKVPHEIWQHQMDLVKSALLLKRIITLSPTASGKSFAIYLYAKYLLENVLKFGEKILLTVPTISLVLQMRDDFISYDTGEIKDKIHTIMGGDDKDSEKQIYISTWQSIFKLPAEYFQKFRVLIIDECHQAPAASLKGIAEKCINAGYRLGTTGTVDEWQTHHIVLEGLLGKIYRITETSTLIEQKILTPLKIYNFIFKYPLIDCELAKNLDYMQELAFVLNHKKRNLAVARIVSQLKGNSLVLFTRIEHGQWLFKKIQELTKGVNKVFYIDGSISAEEREDIRAQFERSGECIGVASIQVFGIGINIKQLHNIVLTSGGKSKIRLLQAIGRGLRLHPSKQILNVIDIVDDLKFKKSNFLLQHFRERVRYYENEKFPYVNIEVKME